MLRERIAPQSEAIRAIMAGDSPCFADRTAWTASEALTSRRARFPTTPSKIARSWSIGSDTLPAVFPPAGHGRGAASDAGQC